MILVSESKKFNFGVGVHVIRAFDRIDIFDSLQEKILNLGDETGEMTDVDLNHKVGRHHLITNLLKAFSGDL